MAQTFESAPRPTTEDLLRALAYAVLTAWGVIYLIFPPPPVPEVLEFNTRLAWMVPTILGFFIAFFGAVFRVDLKMELPGLVFTLPGPIFYGITQLWLVFNPELLAPQDPSTRYAISLYAFVPALLILPRIVGLLKESKRLRRVTKARIEQMSLMTDEELSQPGAGLTFTNSIPTQGKRGGKH